ncbi:cytochrome c oxidase subunit 8A, mitochondrial-like [Hoplias malabaricus]|uniref:cytochrome c oxidase subunit 8A, mitochondrial-like n=1 Tax=Hoplias malabaricus TaxID=27720 RepID=UPI003462DAC0
MQWIVLDHYHGPGVLPVGHIRALAQVKLSNRFLRSNIYCKPPKDKIGAGQMAFAISVFAFALLGPAGWIVHHIPVYRQRSSPQI